MWVATRLGLGKLHQIFRYAIRSACSAGDHRSVNEMGNVGKKTNHWKKSPEVL